MNIKFINIFSSFIFFLSFNSTIISQHFSIQGKVIDSISGDNLPGAELKFEELSISTVSDFDGKYFLNAIPSGRHLLTVNYLGYYQKEFYLQIIENNLMQVDIKLVRIDFEQNKKLINYNTSITDQKINQQFNTGTIVNIVPEVHIHNFLEANAVEKIGRLSNVNLERLGGEASKVIIRGMGPKYSQIQVNDVLIPSTGGLDAIQDRSVDISMIPSEMLQGIELTKSVRANQEAAAIGGVVNFKIKKAPENKTFNTIINGGYNGLRNSYDDLKISIGGSNRFLKKSIGANIQLNYECINQSFQKMDDVEFQVDDNVQIKTNRMKLFDIFRTQNRMSGIAVFDFECPSTQIITTNYFSHINTEETEFINNYYYDIGDFNKSYNYTPEKMLTVVSNSIMIDHKWRDLQFSGKISHSLSKNNLPLKLRSTNEHNSDISYRGISPWGIDLNPEEIPGSLRQSPQEIMELLYMGDISQDKVETLERDLAADINFSYNFLISKLFNVKLSLGSKIKYKLREVDRTSTYIQIERPSDQIRDLIYNTFEETLSTKAKEKWNENSRYIPLLDFFDKTYNGDNFLGGKFNFGDVFDSEKFHRINEISFNTFTINSKNGTSEICNNFIRSNIKDYNGTEDYLAFYIMPEISIGSKFMLEPGLRYESNTTEYTGYRTIRLGVLYDCTPTPIETATKVRKNQFVLPMIQVIYKPTEWLSLKAGFTTTLQRPSFNYIRPGWYISNKGFPEDISNFRLKPELSRNIDFQSSVYFDKIGLFSLGVFHKNLKDMIFTTRKRVITNAAYFEYPELLNNHLGTYLYNSSKQTFIYGIEFEYQSNLRGFINGLFLDINYARNFSKVNYLWTELGKKYKYPAIAFDFFNIDSFYTSPMLQQPKHLLNLTLAYNYRGLSIHLGLKFISGIFNGTNITSSIRKYSTNFTRLDLSIIKKLPFEGMEIFFNAFNITNAIENDRIAHMNFSSYYNSYGRSANLGIRYVFK